MGSDIDTERRVHIIINPSARSGRGQAALRSLLARQLTRPGLTCSESRSPAHFIELVQAAQESAASLRALGIAGGDGTVRLALAALRQLGRPQRVPLCVLPTGSGNDFVHDLSDSRKLAIALQLLLSPHSQPRWLDSGLAEPADGEPQPFCCVASLGLDELALRRIHGSRFPRSQALNLSAALAGLWQYQPRRVCLRWRGGAYTGEVMFVAVTNTRSYGGGFRVSPAARLDDGLLDLCIVPAMPKAKLLWHFPRILRGTHGTLPGLILAQSPWVEISVAADAPGTPERPPELPLCLDGELPSSATPVTLRCQSQALCVLSPRSPAIAAPHRKKEAA